MEKMLSPSSVESRSVRKVISYEAKRGWKAGIAPTTSGYDVRSFNKKNKKEYRCIEVKGRIGNVVNDISLYIKLRDKLGKKDEKNYYIYLVRRIETSKPIIDVIEPSVIFKNLKIKKSYVLQAKCYRKFLKKSKTKK